MRTRNSMQRMTLTATATPSSKPINQATAISSPLGNPIHRRSTSMLLALSWLIQVSSKAYHGRCVCLIGLFVPEPNSYQALQLELALEEISKEVIRLRATQRSHLQQRRQHAQEKKKRAEMRRLQYIAELESLKTTILERDETIRTLTSDKDHLKREFEAAEVRFHRVKSPLSLLSRLVKWIDRDRPFCP